MFFTVTSLSTASPTQTLHLLGQSLSNPTYNPNIARSYRNNLIIINRQVQEATTQKSQDVHRSNVIGTVGQTRWQARFTRWPKKGKEVSSISTISQNLTCKIKTCFSPLFQFFFHKDSPDYGLKAQTVQGWVKYWGENKMRHRRYSRKWSNVTVLGEESDL